MLTDRPARGVSGFMLGIAAVFDITGAAAFRMLRQALPGTAGDSPGKQGSESGAFESATAVIQSAYRETIMLARIAGVTLAA
jgi:hypothetical protein